MFFSSLLFVLTAAFNGGIPDASASVLQIANPWQVQPAQSPSAMPATDQWAQLINGDWRRMRFAASSTKPDWMKTPRSQINCLWYRNTFEIPQTWGHDRVVADFQRIEGDVVVYLNGKRLGELLRPGGYFELTDAVRVGSNELLVFVTRDYTGISRNFEQDKLRYLARHVRRQVSMGRWPMGITAPVILHRWGNPVAIRDVFIQTSWQKKQLQLQVQLDARSDAQALELHTQIKGADGKLVMQFDQPVHAVKSGLQSITLIQPWSDPIPWQLDNSYLYTMQMTLRAHGQTLQTIEPITFGFREITVNNRDILINGVRSPWRLGSSVGGMSPGALSFYRMVGRNVIYYQPHARQWWQDWSESPVFDPDVLDLADQTGTGILLPAVQVDHLREALLNDPQVIQAYQRELAIHLRRYQNHPSVLAWSLGMNMMNPRDAIHPSTLGQRTNYSVPQAAALTKAFAYVKADDPTRLVYSHADGNFGDIATSNLYTNFAPIQEREDWLSAWSKKGNMPFMAVECGNAFSANYIKHHQVLITEYLAMQLGPKAYELETDDALAIITPGTNSRWNTRTFLTPFLQAYWQVQRRDVTLFDRAWRTWGESAGHFPWDFDIGMGTPPGNTSPPVARYATLNKPLDRIPDWVNENFEIHRQNMQPLLAYLAGSPQHSDKTHSYTSGQKITKQVAIIWDDSETRQFTAQWQLIDSTHKNTVDHGSMIILAQPGSVNLQAFNSSLPEVEQRTAMQLQLKLLENQKVVAEDVFDLTVFPAATSKPALSGRTFLWDPKHQSTWVGREVANLQTLNLAQTPSPKWQDGDVLIIGREALTDQYQLPFTHQDIAAGLKVLLLQQQPQMWESLGFKADETYTRRVYAINPLHPVMQGLEGDDLINWAGQSDLLPADRQARSHDAPRYPRVNNLHIVAPVVLQIPESVGFEPILVSGFDLNESPLMQWRWGKGRILFSTLALGERFTDQALDPAAMQLAQNLLQWVGTPTTSPTRHTQMLGDAALAKQIGVTSVASAGELDRLDAASKLWIIGKDAQLPLEQAQSFLSAGGRIAYFQRTSQQLQAMGYAVSERSLRKVSGDADWPVNLSLNLARWRDALEVNAFQPQQHADTSIIGKGIALKDHKDAGQRLFIQVAPDMLASKPNVNEQQRESTQISVTRLRQLDAQLLTDFGASSSVSIAKRLTTMEAGPAYTWLKHWNVLGPIPAAEAHAKTDQLFAQTFQGQEQAIAGDTNPNFTYKQSDGSVLDFRPTAIADDAGFVDLLRVVGRTNHCFAMATTRYESANKQVAILRLGVDYWCQVYVNGRIVYQTSGGPGAPQPNKHQVRINLNAGENIITFKVLPGSKGFGFWANISQIDKVVELDSESAQSSPAQFYTPLPYPFDPYEYHYW